MNNDSFDELDGVQPRGAPVVRLDDDDSLSPTTLPGSSLSRSYEPDEIALAGALRGEVDA